MHGRHACIANSCQGRHVCRGEYFDIGLILDLTSALYSEFKRLGPPRPRDGGAAGTPEAPRAASPLLRTPPLRTPGGGDAEGLATASGHVARQRHLCSQLAERAFAVVLLCLRQREAVLLDSAAAGGASPASIPESDRDALRRFLQRSAAAVVRPLASPHGHHACSQLYCCLCVVLRVCAVFKHVPEGCARAHVHTRVPGVFSTPWATGQAFFLFFAHALNTHTTALRACTTGHLGSAQAPAARMRYGPPVYAACMRMSCQYAR